MDAQSTIKRGLFWLGSANLAMRLIELASTVVVLWFLSKDDLGLATTSWSVAVIIESFNGLGVGVALVQAKEIDRDQLDTLFWYCIGLAALALPAIWIGAPWLAAFYRQPVLTRMIRVSALRLVFAALALVPLQMLNRELRFRDVATIQASAAGLAAIMKVALAASGFGAWALVLGHAAEGLFTALGAQLVSPFVPRLRFELERVRSMLRFGAKAASSGIVYQGYRNLDYFAIGKLWGQDMLGVYRVAFDLAMIPATAALDVVNRTAFPTYSRIGVSQPARLKEAFTWVLRSLSLLVGPITVFVAFAARPILSLIARGAFVSAAPMVRILCVAAFLRTLAQLVPQLLHATGRPGLAFFDSIVTTLGFAGSTALLVRLFGADLGASTVALAWVTTYVIALGFLFAFARSVVPLSVGDVARALSGPLTGALVLAAALWAVSSSGLERLDRWEILGVEAAAAALVCAGFYRYGLGMRFRDLLPRSR